MRLNDKQFFSDTLDRISSFIDKLWIKVNGYLFSTWPRRICFPDNLSVEDAQEIFFNSTFSMLAKICKADGVVSEEELHVIEHFLDYDLQVSEEQRSRAIAIFKKAKESTTSFEEHARQFNKLFRNDPLMLENLVSLLMSVTFADDCDSFEENILLRCAQKEFGIDRHSFAQLKSKHLLHIHFTEQRKRRREKQRFKEQAKTERIYKNFDIYSSQLSIEDHYRMLGCKSSDPIKLIKKRYRALVMKHHPDRLASHGLPQEMHSAAQEKFRDIQEAYEEIKKHRKFS